MRFGNVTTVKFLQAHIPFSLQLFVDYGLYGMSFVHLANVKFRRPIVKMPKGFSTHVDIQYDSDAVPPNSVLHKLWHEGTIKESMLLSSNIPRQSSCQLEVDAQIQDVLNVSVYALQQSSQASSTWSSNASHSDTKLVRSLAEIWQEEKHRRRIHGINSQPTPNPWSQQRKQPSCNTLFMQGLDLDHQKNLMSRLQSLEKLDKKLAQELEKKPSSFTAAESEIFSVSPPSNSLHHMKPSQNNQAFTPKNQTYNLEAEIDAEMLMTQATDREAEEILNWMRDNYEESSDSEPNPLPTTVNKPRDDHSDDSDASSEEDAWQETQDIM